MASIFISHAVADKKLAEKLVKLLKEGIGVPGPEIFCSSIKGHNVPLGSDFNVYMKEKIQNPSLVLILMTESYMESAFCMMELGATWAKSLDRIPIVVPPVTYASVTKTLGLTQGWTITDDAALIDFRQKVKSSIKLEPRSEHDWEAKREEWRKALKRTIKGLPKASKVEAAEYEQLKDQMAALQAEKATLEKANREAKAKIAKAIAEPDPKVKKAILSAASSTNQVADQFGELVDAVKRARPSGVPKSLYRNMIMDIYDRSKPLDPFQDRDDYEAAVQYKIIDEFGDYQWKTPKLKAVAKCVGDLQDFVETQEGSDYLEGLDHPTDPADLDFWQHVVK
ncbi:toll/interleukin-1 receptor domain-containing protein [Agrobacterium tumefaciens]|jgi:hypothetical protein|uniref:toll/interleukin-1 receptor domain-containing protein n=1 Tax=Agrobacterium tumefaciens TaxID=358 RepID=UPI002AFF0ADC|nr:toll/interleukin-1 receptor domain-containing protein [Agrobacterium tumefaciens]MEA1844736.1 toll/interleukin-1 receptor domain-containing protein [Agrobacterium tumefaciens]